jgi:parvulin-like peptidyl-prolyl isomerase
MAILMIGILGCSKTDGVKLEKESAEYNLAKTFAEKVPSLDPDENKVIVKTKEFVITTGEVIQSIYQSSGNRANQFATRDSEFIKSMVQRMAKNLGEKKLLMQQAEESNVTVSQAMVDSVLQVQYSHYGGQEKFNEMMTNHGINIDFINNDIKSNLTINKLLQEKLNGTTVVTDEDILAEYNTDKTASVRHILLMTQDKSDSAKAEIRKKMEDILAEAKSGADFAKLAEKYTEDPGSKDKGGLYENFTKGRMVKPFEDAAFSVPVGEISDIVETRYGYHILKVVNREKETKPFDEVKEEIRKKLTNLKKNEAYNSFIDNLKTEAKYEMLDI